MSDIFDEIDDELRRQRVENLLKKHQTKLIVAAALIVAAVGGWRYYDFARKQAAARAGAGFEEALRLGRDGKASESESALKAIAQGDAAGYRLLSRFALAAAEARKDPAAGIAAYDAIAADSAIGVDMQKLAAIRAGFLRVDAAPYDEVKKRLEPIAGGNDHWRHSAREVLAVAAIHAGNKAEADKWLTALVSDADAPPTIRQRGELMMTVLAGGGQG